LALVGKTIDGHPGEPTIDLIGINSLSEVVAKIAWTPHSTTCRGSEALRSGDGVPRAPMVLSKPAHSRHSTDGLAHLSAIGHLAAERAVMSSSDTVKSRSRGGRSEIPPH
jgi:hypothetical protein